MIHFFRNRRLVKYLNETYIWGADGKIGNPQGYLIGRKKDGLCIRCPEIHKFGDRFCFVEIDSNNWNSHIERGWLVLRSVALDILTCDKNELVNYLLDDQVAYRIIAEDRYKGL